MPKHTNFYETINEAKMRLDNTIVLYDGEPYHVLCVTDHKSDGIFRGYLDPLSADGRPWHRQVNVPYDWYDEESMTRGDKMDQYLQNEPGCPILRKMLNSPKFNNFKPFPLGMANAKTTALYVERTPVRHTQQGLTSEMMTGQIHALDSISAKTSSVKISASGQLRLGVYDPFLYALIKGIYPDVDSCLTNLTDDTVINASAAFHREFCFVKGPMNLLFLAYKKDIVGYLPYNNLLEVKIGQDYQYVKEVVDNLSLFNKIS